MHACIYIYAYIYIYNYKYTYILYIYTIYIRICNIINRASIPWDRKSIRHFNRGNIRKRKSNLQIQNLLLNLYIKKISMFLLRI